MSSLTALFGLGGGGGGSLIGERVVGDYALPPLVTFDGSTFIRTGTIAPSSEYPLAPAFTVKTGDIYAQMGAPLPLPPDGYSASVTNGSRILLFSIAGQNTNTQYLLSEDAGESFQAGTWPATNRRVYDMQVIGGYFFVTQMDNSGANGYLLRSRTGATGTWTQVATWSGYVPYGVAYNGTTLAVSCRATSGSTLTDALSIFSSTSALGGAMTFTTTALSGIGAAQVAYPQIRWGKLGPATPYYWLLIGGTRVYANTSIVAAWTSAGGVSIALTTLNGSNSITESQDQHTLGADEKWMIWRGANNVFSTTAFNQTAPSLYSFGISQGIAYDGGVWVNSTGGRCDVYDGNPIARTNSSSNLSNTANNAYPGLTGTGQLGPPTIANGRVSVRNTNTNTTNVRSIPAGDYTNTKQAYADSTLGGPVYMRIK